MRKMFLAAAFGATVLGGLPAIAQTNPAPPADPRGAGPADANRDGIVTRTEMVTETERRFTAIDANRDGTVRKEEMKAERDRRMAARAERRGAAGKDMARHHGMKHGKPGMGKRLDPDRDGAATRAEWLARAETRFTRVDANKDGRIDAAERTAMRDQRKAKRAAGHTPPPPPAPAG